MKDNDDNVNTNSNEERKNIKLLQNITEEEIKDSIPDIIPTYETNFINGFEFEMLMAVENNKFLIKYFIN